MKGRMQRRVREGYVTIVCYIKKCKDQMIFFIINYRFFLFYILLFTLVSKQHK